MLTLEVVVRTHFLNQLVVDAEERDENADDLEGFGTEPGSVGLGVLCETGLRRVVQAGFGLLGSVGFLVLHPTVKGLCLFGVEGGLPGLLELDVVLGVRMQLLRLDDLKLHHFGWRHDTDRNIPQAGRVVAEVHGERPVDVVHDLPRHQQAELHGLYVEVEVAPTEDLLGLGYLQRGLAFRAVACLVQEQGLVPVRVVRVEETVSGWLGFHGCLVDGSGEDTGLVRRLNHPSCRSSNCTSTHAIWNWSLHHRPHWAQV